MENLESLLILADLVKFAKGNPDPDENIVHLDNAYDFVKSTKDDAGNQNGNMKSAKSPGSDTLNKKEED